MDTSSIAGPWPRGARCNSLWHGPGRSRGHLRPRYPRVSRSDQVASVVLEILDFNGRYEVVLVLVHLELILGDVEVEQMTREPRQRVLHQGVGRVQLGHDQLLTLTIDRLPLSKNPLAQEFHHLSLN